MKAFLEEVWREVHPTRGRVVWPTPEKVTKSTWVVVVMSSVVSAYIVLADSAFSRIIQHLLTA